MSNHCQWSQDESVWATQCGHTFEFTVDGPSENGARYCCYCGGALVEVRTSTLDIEDVKLPQERGDERARHEP